MRAAACWAVCLVAPRRGVGVAAGVDAPLPRRPLGAGDRAVLVDDSPCKARAVLQQPQHTTNSALASQVSSDAHRVCRISVCSEHWMLLACYACISLVNGGACHAVATLCMSCDAGASSSMCMAGSSVN